MEAFIFVFYHFQEILLGEAHVAVAGGTESMSQAPYAVRNIRFGTRLGGKYEVRYSVAFILDRFLTNLLISV